MGLEHPRRPLYNKVTLVKYSLIVAGAILFGFWLYFYNGTKEVQMHRITNVDELALVRDSKTLHDHAPRVLYWENFLSDEECDSIIAENVPRLKRSSVANPDKIEKSKDLSRIDEVRTSSGAWIGRSSDNPIIKKFTKRVSMWSTLPKSHGEDIQFLEYQPGQYYKPHYDFFDPEIYSAFLVDGGQRVASVLCFLNDVPKGGETLFPEVNLSVKPKKGAAIVWFNSLLNGTLDRKSMHGGEPVQEGVKYVVVQWMRQFPRGR